MNDFFTQLLKTLSIVPLTDESVENESKIYDVTTDEGYKKAIELIAEARKTYDNSPAKGLFDILMNGSFVKFLDNLYANVVKTHEEATKPKTDFAKLSETDQRNVEEAIEKYLTKYANASEETKTQAKDILKDYSAWVINTTRN